MLGAEPCTILQWKKSAAPGAPLGATIPPSAASRATVALSMVQSG